MGSRLHIFRAGTYTDSHGQNVSLSAADLAASAAAYDPALHRAPIVVGHPKTNSPAFGWLPALHAQGDDLEADHEQVDPAFAEAVRAGRYLTRSASFWPPDHPDNPRPGVWYLRHVGFLGGTAPAVKGLRGADLADPAEGTVTIDFAAPITELLMPEQTQQIADLAARETALAARESEFTTQAQGLAAREQAIKERERLAAEQALAMRRTEAVAFAEKLADEARIRPADVQRVATVLVALDAQTPAVEFAAADDQAHAARAPGAWLRELLSTAQPLVELAAVATKDRADVGIRPAEFATPAGYTADPTALALHRKAKAYQAAHPDIADYRAAIAAISNGA